MRTYKLTAIASALGTTPAKIKYLCEHRLTDVTPVEGSKPARYTRESAERIIAHHLRVAQWQERQAKEAAAKLFGCVADAPVDPTKKPLPVNKDFLSEASAHLRKELSKLFG